MPDLGLTTVDDMVRNAGMIASLDRDVPVIADADTGYGGPLMVARTVRTQPSRSLPWVFSPPDPSPTTHFLPRPDNRSSATSKPA